MTADRRTVARELGAIVVLLVATLGFFWRVLLLPDTWKPAGGGDLVSFLFPTYRYAATRLGQGDVPLWNPHLYGGAPFLADMQSGIFYPLNLLLFGLLPDFPYEALQWLAAGHVFLAGAFAYLCLRFLAPGRPLRVPAALVGALAYMFSGVFVVHFGNLNLIAVAAWLPLVVLLFWRALHGRRPGLAVGAGAALGVATLAGHLQITLTIGLGLGLAAVVEAWQAKGWRARAWPFLALGVTAAVAVGLSALVLLPAVEYAGLSPRAELPYREAARYSLVPALLGEMVVPALFSSREPAIYWGVWDRVAAGYLGILPLILAGLALLLRRGRRIVFLANLAAAAFLLALGGESVLHGWAYVLLPGFDQMRAPARTVLLVDFALAGLAAMGLDRLLGPLARRAKRSLEGAWRGLVLFGGLAAIAGGAWAYLVVYQAQGEDPILFWRVSMAASGVVLAIVLLAASLAWLGARRTGRLRRGTLGWLAIGLVFFDLASVGAYTDLGHEAPTAGYEHPEVVDFLRSNAEPASRIDSRTDVADVWQPDLALLAGLYDVGGVDNPLLVADVARYWEGLGGRSTRLYDFLGVGYVLGSKEVVLDWEKFSLAFDGDGEVNVYRNKQALPRAFVLRQAVAAANHEDAWRLIHEPGFDPATTVVVEGAAAVGAPLQGGGEDGTVARIVRYEPDSIEIEIEAPEGGYLVLSDPFYPGWRAEVDGRPAELLPANYAFRAVAVPTGARRVTMRFSPVTWRAGLGISLVTIVGLVVAGGLALAQQRRKASQDG
jgi:hypothetical protein